MNNLFDEKGRRYLDCVFNRHDFLNSWRMVFFPYGGVRFTDSLRYDLMTSDQFYKYFGR